MARLGQGRHSQWREIKTHQRREGSFLTHLLTSLATLPPAKEKHSQHHRSHSHATCLHAVIRRFLVRVSYLELYNEEVCDLLNKTLKKKLEVHIRPDIGVHVRDLACFVVKNADEMERLMNIGNKNSEPCMIEFEDKSSCFPFLPPPLTLSPSPPPFTLSYRTFCCD